MTASWRKARSANSATKSLLHHKICLMQEIISCRVLSAIFIISRRNLQFGPESSQCFMGCLLVVVWNFMSVFGGTPCALCPMGRVPCPPWISSHFPRDVGSREKNQNLCQVHMVADHRGGSHPASAKRQDQILAERAASQCSDIPLRFHQKFIKLSRKAACGLGRPEWGICDV